MSECYDCGELFEGFGECPKCKSEHVGIIDAEMDEEYPYEDDEDDEYEEF